MKQMFEELKPTVFLDNLSGKAGSDILRTMPPHSTLVAYGTLANKPYDLTAKEIRVFDYKIVGVTMMTYFKKYPELKHIYNKRIAQDASDGNLTVSISKKFKHENFKEAIDYYKQNTSQGKVILQP